MWPILFLIEGPGGTVWPVHTYGVMRAAAIVVGLFLARWAFRRRCIDPDHIYWAALWVTPVALIGASAFATGQAVRDALSHGTPLLAGMTTALTSGGTYLLALPLVALAFALYTRIHDLPLGPCMDTLALCVAAAMPVQRLGCLAAACCYGKPTNLAWAITYSVPYGTFPQRAPLYTPVHPTQIYEALAVWALFAVLLGLFRAGRRNGLVFWYFVLGYSAIRFVVEFLRDDPRLFLWPGVLSVPQAVCLLGVIVAATVLIRRHARLSTPVS